MLKKILLIFSIFILSIANVFAAEPGVNSIEEYGKNEYQGDYIVVKVNEPLPGMDCMIDPKFQERCTCQRAECHNQTDLTCPPFVGYYCFQRRGFNGFISVMNAIIGYSVHLLIIIAVLSIVVFGIMLSMSGVNPNFKSTIKNALMKALIGILLLFLGAYILYLIAPWVYNAK